MNCFGLLFIARNQCFAISTSHGGSGLREGLEVCRLRGLNRGEEEIDARRVQGV
jgi:hypothetical protein